MYIFSGVQHLQKEKFTILFGAEQKVSGLCFMWLLSNNL